MKSSSDKLVAFLYFGVIIGVFVYVNFYKPIVVHDSTVGSRFVQEGLDLRSNLYLELARMIREGEMVSDPEDQPGSKNISVKINEWLRPKLEDRKSKTSMEYNSTMKKYANENDYEKLVELFEDIGKAYAHE